MAATGGITANWIFTATSTANSLGTVSDPVAIAISQGFTSGTGAEQVDVQFSDEFALAAAAVASHDLRGVLLNAFGGTIEAVEVVAVALVVTTTTAGAKLVFFGGTNAWTTMINGSLTLGPKGFAVIGSPIDGWPTTPGTGDLVRVENTGTGTASYKFAFVSRSA